MNSKEILAIQHWQKVGPGSVLAAFSIVKENANPLVIFLKKKRNDITNQNAFYYHVLLLNLSFCVPSVSVFSSFSCYYGSGVVRGGKHRHFKNKITFGRVPRRPSQLNS